MQRRSGDGFKFSPLTAELIEMAKELEDLGGGPVAVGGIKVIAVVEEGAGDKV